MEYNVEWKSNRYKQHQFAPAWWAPLTLGINFNLTILALSGTLFFNIIIIVIIVADFHYRSADEPDRLDSAFGNYVPNVSIAVQRRSRRVKGWSSLP